MSLNIIVLKNKKFFEKKLANFKILRFFGFSGFFQKSQNFTFFWEISYSAKNPKNRNILKFANFFSKKIYIFHNNNVQRHTKKFLEKNCLFPRIIWGSEANSWKIAENRPNFAQNQYFWSWATFFEKKFFLKQ